MVLATPHVLSRTGLAVRAGPCTQHVPSRVELQAPADGLVLARRVLALARARASEHPVLARLAQAASCRLQARPLGRRGRLRNSVADASSIQRRKKAQ